MTDHVRPAERASPDGPGNAATFRVRTRGRTIVVDVDGELDLAAEHDFERALRAAIAQRNCLIVDLTDVPFMDCAALGALISVRNELEAAAGRLCLVYAGTGVTRLLDVAGIAFPLAESVIEAELVLDPGRE